MLYKKGDRPEKGSNDYDNIIYIQKALNALDCPVGPADGWFYSMTQGGVKQFQKRIGVAQTGAVNQMLWTRIRMDLGALRGDCERHQDDWNDRSSKYIDPPQNALDERISEAIRFMQGADDGQGFRYGGWQNVYQFDKKPFKLPEHPLFPAPTVGKIVPGSGLSKPIHGGTCSPWAGWFIGWLLCANQDFDFRVGRSSRYITGHGQGGSPPGFGDYFEVHGKLRLEKRPLNILYDHWEWMNKVNLVEMSHHVILVLKVGGPEGLHLEDPLKIGVSVPGGLYRLAADGYYPRANGKEYYSGTRQTFRRIDDPETASQAWDFYRCTDNDLDTGCPATGPFAGREPRKMVLA